MSGPVACIGRGSRGAGRPHAGALSPQARAWPVKPSPDPRARVVPSTLLTVRPPRCQQWWEGATGLRAHKSGVGYQRVPRAREKGLTKKVAPPLSGQRRLHLRGRGRVGWEGGGFSPRFFFLLQRDRGGASNLEQEGIYFVCLNRGWNE